jgi:hypothetical protein
MMNQARFCARKAADFLRSGIKYSPWMLIPVMSLGHSEIMSLAVPT